MLRLRDLGAGLGLLEIGAGDEPVTRRELLGALALALGLEKIGPRLRRLRLCLRDCRLRPPDSGLVSCRIDAEEKVALFHPVSLVHRQLDHPAADVGADLDLPLRLHVAAGRDNGNQIAPRHHLRADFRSLVAIRGDRQAGTAEDENRDSGPCGYLALSSHRRSGG